MAYLHGSFAKSTETENSDVDIAVYGNKITADIIINLKKELEQKIARSFDIAILTHTTDPLFAKQIMQYGKVLIERNKHIKALLETKYTLKYFDQAYFRKQMESLRNQHLSITS